MTNHQKQLSNIRELARVDKKSAMLECRYNITSAPNGEKRDWIALLYQIQDDYSAEVMDTYADNNEPSNYVGELILWIIIASLLIFLLGKLV